MLNHQNQATHTHTQPTTTKQHCRRDVARCAMRNEARTGRAVNPDVILCSMSAVAQPVCAITETQTAIKNTRLIDKKELYTITFTTHTQTNTTLCLNLCLGVSVCVGGWLFVCVRTRTTFIYSLTSASQSVGHADALSFSHTHQQCFDNKLKTKWELLQLGRADTTFYLR